MPAFFLAGRTVLNKWGWFLLFLFPVIIVSSFAFWSGRSTVENSDFSGNYIPIVGSEIRYFEDRSGALTVEDIASFDDDEFLTIPQNQVPNFGFNANNVWLKFSVNGNVFYSEDKILEVKNPILNHVDLYERNGSMVRLINATGDATGYSTRMIAHRNFLFALNIPDNQVREYYLMIQSGGEQLLAPLAIMDNKGLSGRDSNDHLVRGSYFGIILFVLLFNLFIYLIIRERSSLYYIHYNLNLLFLQLALSGYASAFFWPDNPWLTNVSTPFFASVSVFALLRFSQHFLNLAEFLPKVNRIFHYSGYAVLTNALLSLWWQPQVFVSCVIAINVMALLLNIAIIPVGIIVLRRNFKPAKFFLGGFIVLVFTVFGFIATNMGAIRNDFFADYGLLIGSAAEVVLLSLAIVDRFKSFKDQALESLITINRIEREQNVVLEQKVQERTEEIYLQKTEIENQKEEIISSIRYAEKIQKNVLPREEEIMEEFPDAFVYFNPKDIVSGDFYWMGRSSLNGVEGPPHKVTLLATGDCTGHGVPGALMSVMSLNLIRETVLQYPESPPDVLLWNLEQRLTSMIRDSDHENAGDGMDVGLLSYRHDNRELIYSGANTNLIIWRRGAWIKLPGTRRAVGMINSQLKTPFTAHRLHLLPGDKVYSWTDGLPDQFGGESGKKLKTPAVLSFLGQIINLPMSEQKKRLQQFFLDWKGDQGQVDDVCVVGFSISV